MNRDGARVVKVYVCCDKYAKPHDDAAAQSVRDALAFNRYTRDVDGSSRLVRANDTRMPPSFDGRLDETNARFVMVEIPTGSGGISWDEGGRIYLFPHESISLAHCYIIIGSG